MNTNANQMSNKPVRVQRKRTKGWKMPENTVYVGRPTKFGNPNKIGQHNIYAIFRDGWSLKEHLLEKNGENKYNDNEDLVLAFNEKVKASEAFRHIIKRDLKGKNLACFCNLNEPCHADILLKVANE